MATKKQKNERLIYIGPSLSKGRLFHGTVFINGLPADAKRIQLDHPWFKQLFVPLGDYAPACKEVAKKGTPLNIFFRKAKEV